MPGEFQIDPYTKTLGDPSRRPEIQNATIEYIASQDYMVSFVFITKYCLFIIFDYFRLDHRSQLCIYFFWMFHV